MKFEGFVFFSVSVFWVGFQVYVVYMGSKTEEHPDEILKQNHQMLASVHRRSAQYQNSILVCVSVLFRIN